MGKKITQLATITEIADDDLLVGVDISDTSGSAEGTNKKFTKANLLSGLAPLNPQLTGWNPDTETWAYHNVDDPTGYIKIEDKDVSANYSVGWRIMFTNGGNVIKGIITAITFTDPDTIITFLHEIDPTDNQALTLMTNSAITETFFALEGVNPVGFPTDRRKWSISIRYDSDYSVSPSTAEVKYNALSVVVPIGRYKARYIAPLGASVIGTDIAGFMTLSTANDTESDDELTSMCRARYSGSTAIVENNITVTNEKIIEVASKTTYYLNIWSDKNGNVFTRCATYHPMRIEFLCDYL